MKYGVVVFKATHNLGDDIQSYATSKFYPHIDYYIDREKIDTFYSLKGEQVATIMAGWYTHSPLNWPPSPYIYPLTVSMHFTHHLETNINGTCINFLDNKSSKDWFLNSYMEDGIGCRDSHTKRMFEKMGLKAWWSGCITLTLEKFSNVEEHGHIICVDCEPEIVEKIQEKTSKTVVDITHEYFDDMIVEERFQLVEEILKLYQGASLIVTPRLHAALPSSALGVPVLLIGDRRTDYRFSDFQKYFSCSSMEDILNNNLDYDYDNPKPNSDELKMIGKNLSDICKDFIKKCEEKETKKHIDFSLFLDNVNRTEILKQYVYYSKGNKYIDEWSLKKTDPYISYANGMRSYNQGRYEEAVEGFCDCFVNSIYDSKENNIKVLALYIDCLIKLNQKEYAKYVVETAEEEFAGMTEYELLKKQVSGKL